MGLIAICKKVFLYGQIDVGDGGKVSLKKKLNKVIT